MELLRRLNDIGYEKTRRTLAALMLSFFVMLYCLVAAQLAPEGWAPAMLAMALCYLVAFVGLVADWFWGRWFASGLGWSGIMVAVLSLVIVGYTPPLAIYGALHGLVVVSLLGSKMIGLYDQQEGWRQRFGMDEYGVARLRKTVTRAAASLPSMILWALAPKEPGQELVHALVGLGLLGAAVVGFSGVVRMRSWGIVALGGVAAGVLAEARFFPQAVAAPWGCLVHGSGSSLAQLSTLAAPAGTVAGLVLLAAVVPFLLPMTRFLRGRRRQ